AVKNALAREFQCARADARREIAERLHQTLRRLRACNDEKSWAAILLDAVRPFARRAAFFAVHRGKLHFLGPQGAGNANFDDVPLASAPAIRNVIQSGQALVAPRTAAELSAPIARVLGESLKEYCHLFPLGSAGVLYTELADPPNDAAVLELLASLAATVLIPAPSSLAGGSADGSGWSALPQQEQELHLRAQRFARVRVAEMRLYRSTAVERGRAQRNLYGALAAEIEDGRKKFREQFLESCPSMVDYLHVEMVRTLANDDGALLGPEYPGSLL
ncbi:MAG: hypothetical protein ABI165_08060, partial [Bryobacteraceae bacterium]